MVYRQTGKTLLLNHILWSKSKYRFILEIFFPGSIQSSPFLPWELQKGLIKGNTILQSPSEFVRRRKGRDISGMETTGNSHRAMTTLELFGNITRSVCLAGWSQMYHVCYVRWFQVKTVLGCPSGNTAKLASSTEHGMPVLLVSFLDSLLQGILIYILLPEHFLEGGQAKCWQLS